jgi:hypothetical protein
MKIFLSQDDLKYRLQYNSATGIFVWRNGLKKGRVAGCKFTNGYINIGINRKMIGAHRLAWLYVCGEFPKQLDHINGNPSDNRIINLRLSNQSQNRQNAKVRADSGSGRKGVVWSKEHNKWRAYIGPKGAVKHLGYFDDPDVAHHAYCLAAREMYAEFARE